MEIKTLQLPDNETGKWLADTPGLCEERIGVYREDTDQIGTWEVDNRTLIISYTDGDALAAELEWSAMTADDIADDVYGFNRGQSLACRRMANQYRAWANEVREVAR